MQESNRTPRTEPSSSVIRSRTHSPILQEQGECGHVHLSHNIVCLLLGTCIRFFGLDEPRSHEILMFACLQEEPNDAVMPQNVQVLNLMSAIVRTRSRLFSAVLFTCNTEHVQ